MAFWIGPYSKAKVHGAGRSGNGDKTICRNTIETWWVETHGPITCRRCLTQIRLRESTLAEIDMKAARR